MWCNLEVIALEWHTQGSFRHVTNHMDHESEFKKKKLKYDLAGFMFESEKPKSSVPSFVWDDIP